LLKASLSVLERLNTRVGNQSNLILDPDLDTYYLMDAVLLKLPEIGAIAAEVGRLPGEENDAESAERQNRTSALAGRLNILLEELEGNFAVAFTASQSPATANRLRAPLAILLRVGHEVADAATAAPALSPSASTKLLDQSFRLWEGVATQLDRLLQQRIDRFAQKRWHTLLFVAVVLLVVAYLFIAFYLAVMGTVSRLDEAARKLAAGDAGSVTLDNRDELGQVVHAFNRVAMALVGANREIQQLNDRLTQENLHMATELDITRRLQQMILPKQEELRQIEELDIAGFMQPAFHVGGDYYDVLTHEGGVLLGIGDVTGHGLESGVLMIMVQTAVRTLLASKETDPVQFFTALNSAIYDNVRRMDSDRNLTLALVSYCEGLLRVSGQHEEMIVVRTGGGTERIDTIDLGFPIGLDKNISAFVNETEIRLEPGDGAVLYTDGITEAENSGGRLYGIERLCAVLSREWGRSAGEIREAVIADVRSHIGEHTVYDDITLLVLVRRPPNSR
jgi:sigma-B regulation protein RsbU (phosphoserine phosphatase)